MKIEELLANNSRWARRMKRKDPRFFTRLSHLHRPRFFWIGCADSRVPANEITGLLPGELFVHRNVANVVYPDDRNCVSALYYAVQVLKVRYVIVCGHYGCGGVRAVIASRRIGAADPWLGDIRRCRDEHLPELTRIRGRSKRADRLCELNVLRQARKVSEIAFVKQALRRGHLRSVHAWIYDLRDGRLRELESYGRVCARSV